MLETVSHNPELDFKMNILQLVKVQIVKGITHLMATAADMPQNQNPNTYSDPQQDEYCDEEENNFEEYYDEYYNEDEKEYYDEDENHSEEYYGGDENSFEEG